MPDEKKTVHDAVADAVKDQTEEKPEDKPVDKVDDKKMIELTPEVQESLNLMQSLKDETLRPAVIRLLAEKQGLLKASQDIEDLSKKDQKKLSDKILASIPEEYRTVFSWLPAAMEQAIAEGVEEKTQSLKTDIQKQTEISIKREVDASVNEFLNAVPDAKNYEKEMTALAKKFPQGEGVPMDEYLGGLYTMASKKGVEKTAIKDQVERIDRNRRNDSGRGSESSTKDVKIGSKNPTIREAVQAAGRGERLVK